MIKRGHFRPYRLAKLAALALMAGAVVAGGTAIQPSASSASAYGCTFAPGYSGALNCIDIRGSGLTVNSSRSEYQPGFTPWPPNICNRTHQWRYTKNGGSQTTRTSSPSSCIPGILISYVDWSNPGQMKDQSSFCARSKNSHTNGSYTNYACKTIKK